MTLRIGMIGPGGMGRAHIARIHEELGGGRVVAVSDVNAEHAARVADEIGATVCATSAELIGSADVDAVMICSYGPAHKVDVVAAVDAGKSVLCEKPLAPTAAECLEIMAAEQRAGRKLVTVGFMRRFDPSYNDLKAVLDSGEIGLPLIYHSKHRNPTVPEIYTWDMAINDTGIHDIDTMRWLLGEEFVSARVETPRKTRNRFPHLQDPLILILKTESGVYCDVEIFVNNQHAYDIQGELVGETGTVRLSDQQRIERTGAPGRFHALTQDHNQRFGQAFAREVGEWISAASRGEHTGSTSWDGYAAACVCDAGVQALTADGLVQVDMIDKPAFYA